MSELEISQDVALIFFVGAKHAFALPLDLLGNKSYLFPKCVCFFTSCCFIAS